MEDYEEPPQKVTKYDMNNQYLEGEVMEEGQEEWLSEGILTDDDYNATSDHDQSADMSHDDTMASLNTSNEKDLNESQTSQERSVSRCSDDSQATNASFIMETSKASGHDSTNIEDTLNNFENSQTDPLGLPDDLDAFLIRKADGKVLTARPREEVNTRDDDDDGNDTDDLLRLLEDGNGKKKPTDKEKTEKETESSDDDEYMFKGAQAAKIKQATSNIIAKRTPAKAVPEDDDITDASSDEAETMKKIFNTRSRQQVKTDTNKEQEEQSEQNKPQPQKSVQTKPRPQKKRIVPRRKRVERRPTIQKDEKQQPTPKQEKQQSTPKQEKQLPAPQEKQLATPKQKKQLPTPKQEKQLPTPKQEKQLPTPKREKQLPTPKQEKQLSTPRQVNKKTQIQQKVDIQKQLEQIVTQPHVTIQKIDALKSPRTQSPRTQSPRTQSPQTKSPHPKSPQTRKQKAKAKKPEIQNMVDIIKKPELQKYDFTKQPQIQLHKLDLEPPLQQKLVSTKPRPRKQKEIKKVAMKKRPPKQVFKQIRHKPEIMKQLQQQQKRDMNRQQEQKTDMNRQQVQKTDTNRQQQRKSDVKQQVQKQLKAGNVEQVESPGRPKRTAQKVVQYGTNAESEPNVKKPVPNTHPTKKTQLSTEKSLLRSGVTITKIPKAVEKSQPTPAKQKEKKVKIVEKYDEIKKGDEFMEDSTFDMNEQFLRIEVPEKNEEKQRLMKPESMDEEIPTDGESDDDEESLYDELPSSESEAEEDWFTIDIRAERATDYLPFLGEEAFEILTAEKERVTAKVEAARLQLQALTTSGRQQAEELKKATLALAELDAALGAA